MLLSLLTGSWVANQQKKITYFYLLLLTYTDENDKNYKNCKNDKNDKQLHTIGPFIVSFIVFIISNAIFRIIFINPR